MAHRTFRVRTIKNPIVARNPHLPGVSCIDRLGWRMTEIQAMDKEQLRKSTISAPLRLMNAAWRLSQASPSSALVVRQISFRGNPGFPVGQPP
jgi:hypothetical protein